MNYVKGWSAYYSDGSVYSSRTTPVQSLPQAGLVVWMLYFVDGTRRIMNGSNFYFWFDNKSTDGVFAATDETALQINDRYPGAYIIEDAHLNDAEIQAKVSEAFSIKEPQ